MFAVDDAEVELKLRELYTMPGKGARAVLREALGLPPLQSSGGRPPDDVSAELAQLSGMFSQADLCRRFKWSVPKTRRAIRLWLSAGEIRETRFRYGVGRLYERAAPTMEET